MDIKEFDYINQCIDLKSNVFYYYKDKYAVDLLKWHVGNGMTVSAVKSSAKGFLMDKPLIRETMKQLSQKQLNEGFLENCWSNNIIPFKLSVGSWENKWHRRVRNYGQTSRSGVNLVLRLDFTNMHNKMFYSLVKPNDYADDVFESLFHPINTENKTLAWARMDIDLDNGEVLVEEIQNDWLRYADNAYRDIVKNCKKGEEDNSDNWFFSITDSTFKSFNRYIKEVLEPYREIWDEAVLSATLHFIRNELGIKRVFYNTWETGNIMKNIKSHRLPPRSLYTKLPKRFGFKTTHQEPKILSESVKTMRKGGNDYEWFLLEI